MTRINTTFKIVYKLNGQKKTAVVSAKDKEAAKKRVRNGARILSISKIDQDGLFDLGDINRILLPDKNSLIGSQNFFTQKFSKDREKRYRGEDDTE